MRFAACLIASCTVLTGSTAAFAQRAWAPVTTAQNGTEFLIDVSSIAGGTQGKTAWFEIDYSKVALTDADKKAEEWERQLAERGLLVCNGRSGPSCQPGINKVATQKQLVKFNCTARSMAITQAIKYRADGTVVSSHDDPQARLSTVVPDSVGESMLNAACKPPIR